MNQAGTPQLKSTPPRHRRWRILLFNLTALILFLTLLISALAPKARQAKAQARAMQTKLELFNLSAASRLFYRDFGRWPSDLTQLTNNPRNLPYYLGRQHDFWKRPYLYTPPNSTNDTHGLVATYGADGLANGNPSDGDMSLIITNEPPITVRK